MANEAVPQRRWLRRRPSRRDRPEAFQPIPSPESPPVVLAVVPPVEVTSVIDGVLNAAGVAPKTPANIVLIGADSELRQSSRWEPVVRSVVGEYHAGRVTLGSPALAMQESILYLPMQATWVLQLRDDLVSELVAAEAAVTLPYEPLPLGILLAAPWSELTRAETHRLAQFVRENMPLSPVFGVEAVTALSVLHDGHMATIGTFSLLGKP